MDDTKRKVGHVPPTNTKRPKIEYPKDKTISGLFGEEFPSLKEFMYEDMRVKSVLNYKDLQEILSKHCLDKQRVKTAIMRLPDNNRRYILLKELGIKQSE